MSRFLLTALALVAALPAGAAEFEVSPTDDWFGRLSGGGLEPGDRLVFHGGTYSDARLLELRHRGTEAQSIVISAKPGETVIFERPDARQNSFNLAGCQHLVLRGFEITGGDAGIRIRADGGHQPVGIRLEALHIHHTGGAAVTCNNAGSYYRDMVFARNHIHHTGGHGEGFYLGCNNDADGGTPGFICDSVIEGNHIHDLKGGTVSQGDAIEIKDGSYGNLVRDNIIHDTSYPGIIAYSADGKARNVIENNTIWNTGDHGIQVAADAVVRNNIVYDTGGDVLHIREHQSAVPGNLEIVGNTLVRSKAGGAGIRVLRPGGGFSGAIRIEGNAVYAGTALRLPDDAEVVLSGNVGSGRTAGTPLAVGAWNPRGNLGKDLDEKFLPTAGSLLLVSGAGARRH